MYERGVARHGAALLPLLAGLCACPTASLIQFQDLCDGVPCDAAAWADATTDAAFDGAGGDGVQADAGTADATGTDRALADRVAGDSAGQDAALADSGPGDTHRPDSAGTDAATVDSGQPDAMVTDGSAPDSAIADRGATDSTGVDSWAADAWAADSWAADSWAPDTWAADAWAADSWAADSRQPDTGVPDSAQPDGGGADSTLPDSAQPDTAIPDAAGPDRGWTCQPLADRIRVTEIDVSPDSVDLTNGDYFAPYKPVILATHAAGASVGWADSSDTVHVTVLNADDTASGEHHTLPGRAVRGLVAHADAHGLLIRGTASRDDQMYIVRIDSAGDVVFDVTIVGDNTHEETGDKWIDSWSHEGRLAWSGDAYGAYFGHTGNFGPSSGNHQGDILRYYDAQGTLVSGGWSWGCSHSLDVRLQHNGSRFGPVCLSDCYPSKGFHFNHRSAVIFAEPSGNCGGSSSGRLGGLVSTADGFVLSFAAPEGRDSRDVALVHISNSAEVDAPIWLTDTPAVDESAPHLARLGPDLLVGWKEGSDHVLAVVDETGAFLEGPVAVAVRFANLDDFATFSNGDAGWAYAWDDMALLKVVRITPCE